MEFNKKQTHQILPYTSLDAYLYLDEYLGVKISKWTILFVNETGVTTR